jgi:hypothetical protein
MGKPAGIENHQSCAGSDAKIALAASRFSVLKIDAAVVTSA